MLFRSEGNTWLINPIVVNHDPGWTNHAFFPWISCDDETGVLSVIYYSDRNSEGDGTYIDATVAMSKDYGASWDESSVSDYIFKSL